jgi:hypothetical protein
VSQTKTRLEAAVPGERLQGQTASSKPVAGLAVARSEAPAARSLTAALGATPERHALTGVNVGGVTTVTTADASSPHRAFATSRGLRVRSIFRPTGTAIRPRPAPRCLVGGPANTHLASYALARGEPASMDVVTCQTAASQTLTAPRASRPTQVSKRVAGRRARKALAKRATLRPGATPVVSVL